MIRSKYFSFRTRIRQGGHRLNGSSRTRLQV